MMEESNEEEGREGRIQTEVCLREGCEYLSLSSWRKAMEMCTEKEMLKDRKYSLLKTARTDHKICDHSKPRQCTDRVLPQPAYFP